MLARSLLVGLGSASAYTMAPSRMSGSVQALPRAAVAQLPTWNSRSPTAHFRMQVQQDIKPEDIYDEFQPAEEQLQKISPVVSPPISFYHVFFFSSLSGSISSYLLVPCLLFLFFLR